MRPKSKRSLQDVVGKETYSVWVEMLRALVPGGRTHRLSVVVAGMLQYALEKAEMIKHKNEEEHSVAMSLIDAADAGYLDGIKELIHDVVDRLFKDAGVSYERVSKRGDHYSIADEVYNEFASWFNYPWD
jgi:signal-transduction protein with cAMP-binding, CBS, and nucleotidyltransferase domain